MIMNLIDEWTWISNNKHAVDKTPYKQQNCGQMIKEGFPSRFPHFSVYIKFSKLKMGISSKQNEHTSVDVDWLMLKFGGVIRQIFQISARRKSKIYETVTDPFVWFLRCFLGEGIKEGFPLWFFRDTAVVYLAMAMGQMAWTKPTNVLLRRKSRRIGCA